MTQAAGYIAESVPTGTRPYRNITFATKDSDIVTDSDTMGYKYIHGRTGKQKTGTEPYRDTAGGAAVETVVAQAAADAVKYDSDLTGTKPDRNITAEFREVAAVGETDTTAYTFESTIAGTKPKRNIVHGRGDIETVADTEFEEYRYITDATGKRKTGTEPYRDTAGGAVVETVAAQAAADAVKYDSDLIGTKPDRSKKQGISDKGMSTTADTESYQYEVKRCGRNRL